MDDTCFPDITKLDTLFALLPAGFRHEAERIALEEIEEFYKSPYSRPASHEIVRAVANRAMFLHTLSICNTQHLQTLCREAFGQGGGPF